jgi:hypothetical protein
LKTWVEVGLDPETFWRKTPREIELIINARTAAMEFQHKEFAWLAWHIEGLARTKKLPDLSLMLGVKRKKKSWQEIQAIMGQWVAVTQRRKQ